MKRRSGVFKMLGCISETCKKHLNCKRYVLNLPYNEYHTLEDLSSFGSGKCSSEGCSVDYWCGQLGDYKMYLEVKENEN